MARTTFSGPVKSNGGFLLDTDATGTDVEGAIQWNSEKRTVELGLGNSVRLELGQELFFLARNNTASGMSKGDAVQFSGSLGNSGRITIELAQADAATPPEYFVGICAEDIPKDTDGYVTFFGKIRGIDTRGGGENWQDGDILYLSGATPGALTKTAPSAPSPDILVAAVVNAAPNGILLVRPSFPTSLSDVTDVLITNPQDGDVLVYSASSGLWVNQQP